MGKWKHYEVWVQTGESKWEMTSLFPDLELASTAARIRPARVRLIEVQHEGNRIVSQELLEEIRSTHPAA